MGSRNLAKSVAMGLWTMPYEVIVHNARVQN